MTTLLMVALLALAPGEGVDVGHVDAGLRVDGAFLSHDVSDHAAQLVDGAFVAV